MKRVIRLIAFAVSVSMLAMVSNMANAHDSYRHRGDHDGYWIGPAIIGGLITYSLIHPRPVYVTQSPGYAYGAPIPPAPAPIIAQQLPPVWYYCQSSQTYYPYTASCSEGWRVVPASPQ